jgi:hypothetical protein
LLVRHSGVSLFRGILFMVRTHGAEGADLFDIASEKSSTGGHLYGSFGFNTAVGRHNGFLHPYSRAQAACRLKSGY